MGCNVGPQIPLMVLLLMAPFALETTAKEDLVEEICKQSQDHDFCTGVLRSDRRSYEADRNQLATISTLLTINQVKDTSNKIPSIANGIQDPVGKKRIGVCKSDYETALKRFSEALELSSSKSYWDMLDRVRDGTNSVIDCENIYRKDPPLAVSPITTDNHNVIKLSEIILIIVDGLLPH